MKKVFKIIVLISILILQDNFAAGGSVYSRFGIGDVIYNFGARRFGMGNLGLSVMDRNFISGLNPASWGKVDLTRLEASLAFVGNNVADATNSFNRKFTYFNGISFVVPIQRDYGIVTSFGILPFTKVRYDVTEKFNNTEVGSYEEELKGEGGISKFYFGATYKTPLGVNIGASFEYYFGKIEYFSNLIFPDTSTLRNVGYIQRKSFLGIGATFGAISEDLNKVLEIKNIENLRVGVLFSPSSKINTDTTISTNNLIGGNQIANGVTKTKIPMKLGFGLSFVLQKNFLFSFDYLSQDWSQYEFANSFEEELTSAFKASFGLEYFKHTTPFSPFWEQVRYRFGLSYQKTPYKILGEDIFQYSV